MLPAAVPYLPPRLRVLPAARLEDDLLLAAGARSWDRNPIDFKLLSNVVEVRNRLPDSETESTGHPRYSATARDFDPALWNLQDMSPKAGSALLWLK